MCRWFVCFFTFRNKLSIPLVVLTIVFFFFFFVQCTVKQLLNEVFVISRINKDSLGISVITPTSTLIILDITKTLPNNCLKSDQIVTHKNTKVFHMVNKLLKVCVLLVNDSRIHRFMKITWDDSAVELGLLLKKSERISEQALSCSLRGGGMQLLRLDSFSSVPRFVLW